MSNIKSLQRLLVVQSIYQLSINRDAVKYTIKDIFNQIIENSEYKKSISKSNLNFAEKIFLGVKDNSDEIRNVSNKTKFKSNNAGGILGGISTGQEIVVSFAVKPTSSILNTRETINKKGKNTKISVKGRHDPCVGIRAVPIGEAMFSCVLLDHYLLNRAQCG